MVLLGVRYWVLFVHILTALRLGVRETTLMSEDDDRDRITHLTEAYTASKNSNV